MSRAAAGLAVLVSLSAFAANAPKAKAKAELSRTAGKIIKSSSKIAPGPDGPEFREGRVTIFDKADHVEEFKATPRTKVTLDGKPAKFQKAASIGALVLKALYDVNTKELAVLDLKSGPKPDADDPRVAESVRGEIANTDVLKSMISVRTGRQAVREFAVTETTKILREAEGKPEALIPLEALQVGDGVEVHTDDGKTAAEIHARAAR